MDIDLGELAAYINAVEIACCGAYHSDKWPNCSHESHDRAKGFLEALGFEAVDRAAIAALR